MDRQQLRLLPTCPKPLLGRLYDEELILLSASPDAGARLVEGSGVQSEEDVEIRCIYRIVSFIYRALVLKRFSI